MLVELRDIDSVTPYDKNPRLNDGAVEAVAKSLQQFGFRQPIVVDKDGVIVVGHTRWRAAKQLGMQRVPVHCAAELTPEQARAYRIADNATADNSTFDYELLPLEIQELEAMNFDLSTLGFSDEQLADIMAPPANAGLVDPDDVPEPPETPVTRPGDLWIMGEHRLLCGDSTNAEDVALVMDGQKASLCLTDPPYGVEYQGGTADRLSIANDTEAGLEPLLRAALGNAASFCKPGAVWYVAAPAGPQFLTFARVLTDLGIWRQTLAWVKDSMVLGHSDFHYRHEAIFYGWVPGKHRAPPTRTYTTVLEFARPKASLDHPTKKPVELWSFLMSASTAKGALVYEPFSGSGTTIIACEQQGRKCCAIEIEPRYCDVAVARWEAFTGKKAERVPAGSQSEKAPKRSGAKKAVAA
jgi:DNA modification methylase